LRILDVAKEYGVKKWKCDFGFTDAKWPYDSKYAN